MGKIKGWTKILDNEDVDTGARVIMNYTMWENDDRPYVRAVVLTDSGPGRSPSRLNREGEGWGVMVGRAYSSNRDDGRLTKYDIPEDGDFAYGTYKTREEAMRAATRYMRSNPNG